MLALGSLFWSASYGPAIALRAMESPASVFVAYFATTLISLAVGIPATRFFGLSGAVWASNAAGSGLIPGHHVHSAPQVATCPGIPRRRSDLVIQSESIHGNAFRRPLLKALLPVAGSAVFAAFVLGFGPGWLSSEAALRPMLAAAMLLIPLCVILAAAKARGVDPQRTTFALTLLIWWFVLISDEFFNRISDVTSTYEGQFSGDAYSEVFTWLIAFLNPGVHFLEETRIPGKTVFRLLQVALPVHAVVSGVCHLFSESFVRTRVVVQTLPRYPVAWGLHKLH